MTRLEAMEVLAQAHVDDINETYRLAARKLLVGVSKIGRVNDAVSRYVAAKINDSWKGGGYPEEIPNIEKELREAKENLDKVLEEVFIHET